MHRDPEIASGALVFEGTRVPVWTLFNYLQGGNDLAEFREAYPHVPLTSLMEALDQACVGLTGQNCVGDPPQVQRPPRRARFPGKGIVKRS